MNRNAETSCSHGAASPCAPTQQRGYSALRACIVVLALQLFSFSAFAQAPLASPVGPHGNPIPTPAPVTDAAGTSKNVWIAVRQDGKRGSGSQLDPLDGSTPTKLDALLSSYGNNIVINLLSGTFTVIASHNSGGGNKAAILLTNRSNVVIRGAGKYETTLKLTGATTGVYNTVIGGTGNTGVTIENLDIDLNFSGLTGSVAQVNTQGVALLGSNNTVRNVRVLNAAGQSTEVFPISLAQNNAVSLNNRIEHCEVIGGTGQMTAISLSNNDSNNDYSIYTSGVVEGCYVSGAQIAYGGFSMGDVEFRGNKSSGCTYAVNIDSDHNRNVSFIDNTFLGCVTYGLVTSSGTPQKDFRFIGNYVEVPSGATGFLIGNHANAILWNNRVLRTAGSGGYIASINGTCTNLRIEGTTGSVGMALGDSNGATGVARNNRDETGALISPSYITASDPSTGSFSETTTVAGVYSGIVSGTPRIMLANGTAAQNWEWDNSGGTMRWFQNGSVKLTLSGTLLSFAGSIVANGTADNVFGAGTWAHTDAGISDVDYNNGSTSSPQQRYYYGNNANFGTDVAPSASLFGLSGEYYRIGKNFGESGGAVLAGLDLSGNVSAIGTMTIGGNGSTPVYTLHNTVANSFGSLTYDENGTSLGYIGFYGTGVGGGLAGSIDIDTFTDAPVRLRVNGVEQVKLTSAGTAIGGGTPIKWIKIATTSVVGGSLSAETSQDVGVSVVGAVPGDAVTVTAPMASIAPGNPGWSGRFMTYNGWVSTNDNVTFTIANPTNQTLTFPGGSYTVKVTHY